MGGGTPHITVERFHEVCAAEGGMLDHYGFVAEHIGYGEARVRMPINRGHIRAGGTVSGPAMMALGDFAVYALIMGMIGPVRLAVTTSLNVNFLRRPAAVDIVAEARILKLGKRLAVAEAHIYSVGEDDPVAHITATYSIPPPELRD
jgi:uncharacterized protein (TIGR00369 family)